MNSLQAAYNQFRNPAKAATTGDAYYRMQNEKARTRKEEKQRLEAMDPNKSKFMSPEEKHRRLNAYTDRRFREKGIGHIPGEGMIAGVD
jgi:hypothetical protein